MADKNNLVSKYNKIFSYLETDKYTPSAIMLGDKNSHLENPKSKLPNQNESVDANPLENKLGSQCQEDRIAVFFQLFEIFKSSPSVLLRHEVLYVLGQLELLESIVFVLEVSKDLNENEIIRHEAIEALGSLLPKLNKEEYQRISKVCFEKGNGYLAPFSNLRVPKSFFSFRMSILSGLSEFLEDSSKIVSETALLTTSSMNWKAFFSDCIQEQEEEAEVSSIGNGYRDGDSLGFAEKERNKFERLDPVNIKRKKTEISRKSLEDMHRDLCDVDGSLPSKYMTLISMREMGEEACPYLLEFVSGKSSYGSPSALLGHEIAFVLGQIGTISTIKKILDLLEKEKLHPVVKHELVISIGTIGSVLNTRVPEDNRLLNTVVYCLTSIEEDASEDDIVRESCSITLNRLKEEIN